MKQIFTSILIVAALVGCGTNDKKDQPVTTSNSQQLVLPQPYAPVAGTLPSPNQVTTMPINPAATNTTGQVAGMNPAHGQPGHRCELAVGAPLNSPSKATTPSSISPGTTTSISEPVITTSGNNPPALNFNPLAAKTVTAPGMNPAHGEPGHVCGTPVGSPLNSKPTVAAPTTNPFTQTIKTEQAPTTKVATAPGMNPPHGEPGHVCGTPVGSPLNGSKTADAKTTLTPSIVAAADSSRKQ